MLHMVNLAQHPIPTCNGKKLPTSNDVLFHTSGFPSSRQYNPQPHRVEEMAEGTHSSYCLSFCNHVQ